MMNPPTMIIQTKSRTLIAASCWRRNCSLVGARGSYYYSTISSHNKGINNRWNLQTRCIRNHRRFEQGFSILGKERQQQRRSFSASSSSGNENSQSKKGNVFITIGWTILGLVAIDQILQYKQEYEEKEKHQMLMEMQYEADHDELNIADFDETLPTLFQCRLLHIEPTLDGTKMLTRNNTKLQKDDVVDILEANIGPNQAYHLCKWTPSIKNSNNNREEVVVIGWYPIQFLERI